MSTMLVEPAVVATFGGVDYEVREGSTAKLDATAVPYATADLEIPLVSDSVLDDLDPRDGVRFPFTAGEAGGTPRQFDLGLRSRQVDHSAKTVTLQLASDEALAQDYATLSDDSAPLALQASLRAVVNYVLGKIPAIARNLITAPRGTSLTGWSGSVGGGAAPTLSLASTPGMNVGGLGIDTFMRAEAVGAGTYIDVRNSNVQGILTGAPTPVTASAYVRPSSVTSPTGVVYMQFVDAGGATLATVNSSPFTTPSGQWTRVSMSGTAPAGTVWVRAIFRIVGTIAAGSRIDTTAMMVEQSPRLNAYKDTILTVGTDANVTAYWNATNLHPNPLPASATGYNIAANGTALTFTTLGADNVIRWTSSAATSNLNAGTTSAYRATPGRRYYAAWDWASAAAGRSAGLVMEFRSANGTVLMSRTSGAVLPYSAAFQTLSVSAVAPAGTETVYVYVTTTGNSVATMHYMKRFVLAETDQPVPFFYGGSADANYTYAWTDVASASPSTRTALVDRPPDALIWKAGQTAWDFLLPLTASVEMVLWCDELRQWFLKAADDRTIPTLIAVSALNARSGTDTLSRNDTDAYVTGVVARYTWTDTDGIPRERTDSAGTPDKVLVQEFAQAFPGAGIAAAMLARRQGTGRVQEADTIVNWDATPGMTLQFTLPGAPEVVGRLASVEFDLAEGFMSVGAVGLVDIVPGSIAALAGTIAALPGTIASL